MPKRVLKSLFSRKSKVAKRMKERRLRETATETAVRRAQDRERIARRRAQETHEETAARQRQNREMIARRRARETADETAARQARDRERKARRRAQETADEKATRQARDRERIARRRAQEKADEIVATQERNRTRKPPSSLNVLLQGNNEESVNLLTNIRKYNSVFQMTSCGAGTIITEPGYQTLGEASVECEKNISDAVMEVLEIKMEPFYDEEQQNALLNLELTENEEKTITPSSATVEALSLCDRGSHAVCGSVVAEGGQENNCSEVTGKTENTLVKVKTEPPELQGDEAVLGFGESNSDNLDCSKDVFGVEKES